MLNWINGPKAATSRFPVILSFIAALIFWTAFSHLPEHKRSKKLRPVVELALFDAYEHGREISQKNRYSNELQTVVLSRRPLDRDRFIYKMQHLLHAGQFRACRSLINAESGKFPGDAPLWSGYLALCERGLGNMKTFYRIIEDTYEQRPYSGSLVASRGMFREVMNDYKLLEILAQFHSAEEVEALKASVRDDHDQKLAFERANKSLGEYFNAKASSVRAGTD